MSILAFPREINEMEAKVWFTVHNFNTHYLTTEKDQEENEKADFWQTQFLAAYKAIFWQTEEGHNIYIHRSLLRQGAKGEEKTKTKRNSVT